MAILFLLIMGACTTTSVKSDASSLKAQELFPEPPRPGGQTDVLELRCDPIETVRVAFIGVGSRGTSAVRRYTFLEGVKIVALCDIVPEQLEKAQQLLQERGLPPAETYSGPEDWKKVCERDDVDLILSLIHI